MIRTSICLFLLCVFNLVFIHVSFSQEEGEKEAVLVNPLLFAADEPIRLTLIADFQSLIKEKDAVDPEYYPAVLNLIDSAGGDKSFEIKVRARGISRRNFDFCNFPPLLLNFKKKETRETVFEGQNKLKLVTFCKDMNSFEEYVLKEYLVYKIFNILTDTSLQARLVRINYINQEKDKLITERFGFLIEDIDHLADRLGGGEIELSLPHHDICERTCLDRFMIFQYMIGNTDWWIAKPIMHNVKLISINNGPPIPIPYDFDFCGFVDTNYASPDEKLPIKSVTQRYFRGFCRRSGTYEKTIQGFKGHREEIFRLINDFPWLSEVSKKVMAKYIDQFYDIINDPKQIIRRFYDACEIQHEHLHKL
ncbi:MAG: hypothetical protein KFF73_20180 [Cyclobacteriaceae bacterium]|nr:hypothetical protein [Cyclobacteriaceae bacterium]